MGYGTGDHDTAGLYRVLGRRGRGGCTCHRRKDGEPCDSCYRRIEFEEEIREDPEAHPDYEDMVEREERSYEKWIDYCMNGGAG